MTPFGIRCQSSILRLKVVLSVPPLPTKSISPSPVHLHMRISSIVPRELCLRTAEIIGMFCVCVHGVCLSYVIWRTDSFLVFPDYGTVCMSPDLLGLER